MDKAEQTDRTIDQTRTTADTKKNQWTEHRHRKQTSAIGQPSPNRGRGREVEVKELEDKLLTDTNRCYL